MPIQTPCTPDFHLLQSGLFCIGKMLSNIRASSLIFYTVFRVLLLDYFVNFDLGAGIGPTNWGIVLVKVWFYTQFLIVELPLHQKQAI